VLIGFICSGTLLLIYSWALFVWPELPAASATKARGIPVKDYISQSAMFVVCLFALMQAGLDYWRAHRRDLALASIALALIFLSNVLYIATSRTALVVVVTILVVFGFRQFKFKGAIVLLASFFILAAAAWPSATYLQVRVNTFVHELKNFQPDGPPTPAGERLVFWMKSVGFIKAAPVIGHGTGSIHNQFVRSTAGRTGMAAEDATNPHNQILAVGIQLGFIGVAVLLAMWIAHLAMFRHTSLAAWVGLVVVIQNIVGSLFNSHLADFTHGWLYVIGVGVAGGIAIRETGGSPDRNHGAS
jgi:O-antigen ligase